MNAYKYNYKTERYQKHKISDKWNCVSGQLSFDTFVNCAQCGKLVRYGYCLNSWELRDENGRCLSVCNQCNAKEYKRKLKDLERRLRKGK